MKNRVLAWSIIAFSTILLFCPACDPVAAPLDADTRLRIDTTVLAINRKAQIELDNQCKQAQLTILPKLIDSIKQVRKREIEAQLRNIPK